jgi:chemotaxis protein MotB
MRTIRNEFLLKSITIIFFLASCVPAKKLEDTTARKDKCEETLSSIRAENLDLSTKNKELTSEVDDLKKIKTDLERDTAENGIAYRRLASVNNQLTDSYDKLILNNDKLLAGKTEEEKKVINDLQKTQLELFKKEDSLRIKEAEMNDAKNALKAREARISELEGLMNKQDSMMKALKNTLTQALKGYKDKGISIEEKNGMIYVSMEERLMFASGSIVVDKNGAAALKDLGAVLGKNPDIQVLIQGNTDNVPITTACIKDNWDLSVLRATSVVRILLNNPAIVPAKLSPAGKGEFVPIASNDTAESRKKNRRIDVILLPNLGELLKAVGDN